MSVSQLRDLGERLQGAGRGLAVDDRDQLGPPGPERALDGVGVDQPPPFAAHRDHFGAAPLRDLDQQQAEATELGDDHPVAGLDQRGERRLEAGSAGTGHGKRARVGGLEREPRELHDLVHDLRELRVELTQERCRHRAQHARVRHGRPGAQEDARTGKEIAGGHADGNYN